MALTQQYTAPFRTVFPSAYLRVAGVYLYDARTEIELWIYPDAATRQADPAATLQRRLIPVSGDAHAAYFADPVLKADTRSPKERAYTCLKTISEFQSAQDC